MLFNFKEASPEAANWMNTKRVSRRFVVQSLAALGAVAATGSIPAFLNACASKPALLAPSAPISPNPVEMPIEEIKARIDTFEEIKGYKPVTFEEATSMLPIIVAGFTKSPPQARSSVEFLTERTFIVRGYENEAQKVADARNNNEDANIAVQNFMRDYPGVKLSRDDKKRIANYALGGNVAGWVGDKGAFILLSSVNDVIKESAYKEGSGKLTNTEWENNLLGEGNLGCQPSQPAVFLRTLVFHELTHLDSLHKGHKRTLSDSIIRAYNYLWHQYASDNPLMYFTGGNTWQFGIALDSQHGLINSKVETTNTGLLEYSTDMLAAMKTFNLGLNYVMPAYDIKQDYVNFEKVLNQAGIEQDMFAKLYYDSRLEDFLMIIANGANNIIFQNDIDQLIFGISLFTLENNPLLSFTKFPWGSKYGPDWNKFKPYFPEIDATVYQYKDRFTATPPANNSPWVCLEPVHSK